MGYFTEAVSLAFQQIYDDVENATGKMCDFWKEIARNFKNQTSALGYELFNEPWAGDNYRSPDLFLPGVAGKKNLIHLYDRLNAAIRQEDTDTMVFYEPLTWGIVTSDGVLGTGIDHVPGGLAYRDRSVLSYHYYTAGF